MIKKGVSVVIAMVLMILMTILAVVILWGIIIPMVADELQILDEFVNMEIVADEGYTSWDDQNRLVEVQIARGEDDAVIIGFGLVFVMDGNSVTHYVADVLATNARKTYYVNLSNYSGDLEAIKLVAVFPRGKVGPVISELRFDIIDSELGGLTPDGGFVAPNSTLPGGGGGGGGGGATCSDGVKNQDETDIDCGGLICSACSDGSSCSANSDCSSSDCTAGVCVAVVNCVGEIDGVLCGASGACINESCVDSISITGCVDFNYSDSYYVLDQNIVQSFDTTCFIISANNVILDCQGHSITSPSIVGIAGVYSNSSNSIIKNCDVSDLENGFGIYLDGSDNSIVSGNTANNNDFGIYTRGSSYVRIFDNVANDNEVHGIFLGYGNPNNIVENNVLINNSLEGVDVHLDAFNTTIRNNNFSENLYAISVSDDSTVIENNEIYGYGSYGIYLTSSDNLISNNLISNVINGISLAGGASNNVVENNVINSTATSGIDFVGATDNVIRNNTVSSSGFAGMNMFNSPNNNFTDNNVFNSSNGIYLWAGSSGNIMDSNWVCNNTVDFYCVAAQALTGNQCSTGNGCSGSCSSC